MAEALATKYRPHTWDAVCEQESVRKILQYQIETGTMKHAYLFCGSAGTGKTTCARIFANEINQGKGEPVEMDMASNNGVDDVRMIIQQAKVQSLDSEYRIFICDECFPANAQVSVPTGYKNISDIKVGDEVFCISGVQKVTSVFVNRVPVERLCRVRINGRDIITTLDHLFFTNVGWVEAHELQKGDIVYDRQSVSELWEGISEQAQRSEVLLFSLLSGVSEEAQSLQNSDDCVRMLWERISSTNQGQAKNMLKGVSEKDYFECTFTDNEYRVGYGITETVLRKNEAEQSHVESSQYRQNACNKGIERNTSCLERGTWGKREVHYTADTLIRSVRQWLGHGVCDKNGVSVKRTPVPYVLQSRPRFTRNSTCGRGRWQIAPLEKAVIKGLEERAMSNGFRVESVEVYQRGSNDRLFSGSFSDTEMHSGYVRMYDLEVSCVHNYFVNDILVHNCHSITPAGWQAFLKTLEEPPKKSIFIFCTTNPERIPSTILSRVQRYDFKKLSQKAIVNRLKYIIDCENGGVSEQPSVSEDKPVENDDGFGAVSLPFDIE